MYVAHLFVWQQKRTASVDMLVFISIVYYFNIANLQKKYKTSNCLIKKLQKTTKISRNRRRSKPVGGTKSRAALP